MSKAWPNIRLGEILIPVRREEAVDPAREYRLLGVRLDGNGPFLRETVTGSQTAALKLFRVANGDFIYSRLFACRGALGVIGRELDGCYVSGEFPLFAPVPGRLDVQFLHYWFRLPAVSARVDADCSGSTPLTRNRFNERFFVALEIPLPPISQQRRIVARIEELAGQIKEARDLRQAAALEAAAFKDAMLSEACVGGMTQSWRLNNARIESARELLQRIAGATWPGQTPPRRRKATNLPSPPKVPPAWVIIDAGELQKQGAILDIQDGNHGGDYPRKMEFGSDGVPFVTAKQIQHGTVRINDAPRLPKSRAQRLRIGFAKAGDVLLTHNASVGQVAIAPPDSGDFLLGTSVTYWRCNREALEPRYLFYFMQSPHFQTQLHFIMKQTTRNQVSVLKQVNLWVCVPPLAEQRWIVAELDALQAQVELLESVQTEAAAELDALLPAILDRAFKGDLV